MKHLKENKLSANIQTMSLLNSFVISCFISNHITVKPVNKGHPRERQNMVFIDRLSSYGGYFVLCTKEGLFKCGLYSQDGLCSEVTFNTGLTLIFPG